VDRVYPDLPALLGIEVHPEISPRSLDLLDHLDRLEIAELQVFLVWTVRKESEVTVVSKDLLVYQAGTVWMESEDRRAMPVSPVLPVEMVSQDVPVRLVPPVLLELWLKERRFLGLPDLLEWTELLACRDFPEQRESVVQAGNRDSAENQVYLGNEDPPVPSEKRAGRVTADCPGRPEIRVRSD